MKLVDKIIAEINANEVAESAYEADCLRCSALQTIRKWLEVDGIYQFTKNHGFNADEAEDFIREFYAAYNNEVQFTY